MSFRCFYFNRVESDSRTFNLVNSCDYSTTLIVNFAFREWFDKVDHNTKLLIKDKIREISFPNKTLLNPPSEKVKTKDTPKKVSYMPIHGSTKHSPSLWEHIDSIHSDNSISKPKLSCPRKKNTLIGNPLPNLFPKKKKNSLY